jgi:hypothetical protein
VAAPRREAPPLAKRAWGDARLRTLALANALGLFAQLGLVAHLVSLLAPVLGSQGAGLAVGLATACAMAGRGIAGWVLRPEVDRRKAAAANYAMQSLGVVLLAAAGGDAVLLVLAVALFGLGIGNATTLPPLIAQQDFAEADVLRVVALVVASGQATYAFAPAIFGLLREVDPVAMFAAALLCQLAAAAVVWPWRVRSGARC